MKQVKFPEPDQVLQHRIFAFGQCIMSEPNRGAPSGHPTSLDPLSSHTPLEFGFCLD
jgi:hypothetical protein